MLPGTEHAAAFRIKSGITEEGGTVDDRQATDSAGPGCVSDSASLDATRNQEMGSLSQTLQKLPVATNIVF